MVFALGAQVSKAIPPEQRQETGKMYYNRAQMALNGHTSDTASVDLVSYLLLTGVFLQTNNLAQRCWMVVGNAIRMAQSLGLHQKCSNIETQPLRKLEITRRVWHGCILMDRVLSMTFGRPTMISNGFFSAAPLPLAIDDEFLNNQEEGSVIRLDGHPCLMAFYSAQIQFYDIVNDILTKLYIGPGEPRESMYDIATVLHLDNALVTWIQKLPSQLQHPCPLHLQGGPFQQLGIINKARFLFTKILLFRPILARFCLKCPDITSTQTSIQGLSQLTIIQCCGLCIKDAHEVIELVYNNLNFDTVTGPLPSWWYCILYIYSAATVLLAQRLQPVLADDIGEYSVDVSWNRSIEILAAYSRVGASAKQCVAALKALSVKNPWEPSTEGSQRAHIPNTRHDNLMPLSSGVLWDDAGLGDSGFDFSGIYWLHNFPDTL